MKIKWIFLGIILGLLCALFGVFLLTESGSGRGMLYITPKKDVVFGVSADAIEEINENRFMLTYISQSETMVKALDKNFEVTLIGTNFSYPYTAGFQFESGGFFTQDMQKHGNLCAVLNGKAAFDMFGGNATPGSEITLNGGRYTVLGTISDGEDEDLRVYIPAQLLNMSVSEIICPLDEALGISAEYVKSELKYIGITDDKYMFADTEQTINAIKNNFISAVYVLAFWFVLLAYRKLARYVKEFVSQAKTEMEHAYIGGFISENRARCIRAAAAFAGAAGCIGLILAITAELFGKYLFWSGAYETAVSSGYFTASNILLAVYIFAFGLCAFFWKR